MKVLCMTKTRAMQKEVQTAGLAMAAAWPECSQDQDGTLHSHSSKWPSNIVIKVIICIT